MVYITHISLLIFGSLPSTPVRKGSIVGIDVIVLFAIVDLMIGTAMKE